jgi:hypothetical protein
MGDSDDDRSDELLHFGTPPRFDIRMVPLLGTERPSGGAVVVAADTPELRESVVVFAEQFRRETHYDFVPFDADDPSVQGALFVSLRFMATFPIAAGAAGLTQENGEWLLEWVWLHPYERGGRLFDRVWSELERKYGQFHIAGPYSAAMEKFLVRREIQRDRWPAEA